MRAEVLDRIIEPALLQYASALSLFEVAVNGGRRTGEGALNVRFLREAGAPSMPRRPTYGIGTALFSEPSSAHGSTGSCAPTRPRRTMRRGIRAFVSSINEGARLRESLFIVDRARMSEGSATRGGDGARWFCVSSCRPRSAHSGGGGGGANGSSSSRSGSGEGRGASSGLL